MCKNGEHTIKRVSLFTVLTKYHLSYFRNSVQLVLNIQDVNDNAPQFVHNKYEARLQENQSDFDTPLIVEARDLDLNGE